MSSGRLPTCNVSWYDDGVLEFIYRGEVSVADLRSMAAKAKSMMEASSPQVQLVDTLDVVKVPAELGQILNSLLEAYRLAGGRLVVMVVNSQLNQMLGRSMSFGSGVELEMFEDRGAAIQFIRAYAVH